MTIPNFIICGAQKSGTTSLYQTLGKHPSICLSSKKEVHFFDWDENFSRGWEWYEKFFEHCREDSLTCEATPHYYRKEKAAKRISRLGNAKLIFIIRDPVDRAYSNYWHNKQRGSEVRTFSEAIESKDGIKKYLNKGLYYKHISKYTKYIDKDDIKIVTFESFVEETGALKEIMSFLNVDYVELEIVSGNKTRAPSSHYSALLRYYYKKMSPWIPNFIKVKTKKIRSEIKKYTEKESYKKIDDEKRSEVGRFFVRDMKMLNKEMELDISEWKSFEMCIGL